MTPIRVIWNDAVSCDAWVEGHEQIDLDLHLIHTFGYLIFEDDQKIIVALNIDKTGDSCSQRLAIPKPWIKEVMYLPEEKNV